MHISYSKPQFFKSKYNMKISKLITLSLVTICIYSCSYDSENDLINASGSIDNPPGTSINYTDNIRPLMQNSCVGCHANPPTNGAPFSLVSFSQVSARANAVLSAMNRQSGSSNAMPPSGRLPQATIDLIQLWIDNGKPEN